MQNYLENLNISREHRHKDSDLFKAFNKIKVLEEENKVLMEKNNLCEENINSLRGVFLNELETIKQNTKTDGLEEAFLNLEARLKALEEKDRRRGGRPPVKVP